jgi:phosphatidate cytidylyltransferase
VKSRLATAAVLIPLVLGVVLLQNNVTFFLLSAALVGLSTLELQQISGSRGWPWLATAIWVGLSGAVLIERITFWPLVAALALFASSLAVLSRVKAPAAPWQLELGAFWPGAPFIAIMCMHEWGRPSTGLWYAPNLTLMSLTPIWAGDSLAIVIGRAFGKRPLAPTISPGKTVAGALANFAACVLLAVLTGAWLHLPWPVSLACGVAAGIAGQAGDLFESYVKRRLKVKDSSNLLPGHGGFLDRMDSLFFTSISIATVLAMTRR